MHERMKFVVEASLRSGLGMAELCRLFGVSRKTGYKWLARYQREGAVGLRERTSAPGSSPQRIEPPIAERIVQLRRQHPTWGPRKLLEVLSKREPRDDWPAASTAGDLLRRRGLVNPRKRKRRASPSSQPFAEILAPNDTWCVDFKGQFRVGTRPCYPLTVSDAFSRFLLGCDGMDRIDGDLVRRSMERIFREYGLPRRMRSDNGPPFASVGRGGLSKLSVWWIRLGILPERIQPGEPQQNGRHERMHRTLKEDVPRLHSLRAQQGAFETFRRTYNEERPHESLGMRTPSGVYQASTRPFPSYLPEIEYPDGYELRRVRSNGEMKWRSRLVFVSGALAGEIVGLRPEDDGLWTVTFGPVELGHMDDRVRYAGLVRPRWGQDVLPRSPV